jgi:succinoglycan biosynthesis protein ExoO
MAVDVSVIMPAYRAGATIGRAIASVFAQKNIVAELVLCADDDLDYCALVPDELRSGSALTLCRTPNPKSGPSLARNIALSHARADIIACLDADDVFAPQRLARLLPLAEHYGLATGPTIEVHAGSRAARVARPRRANGRLPVEDICELRMPFAPVFHRAICPQGWPQIRFAEDVILNLDLHCATGVYPFVEGADYIYHLSPGSRTQSVTALREARTGYLEILALVDTRFWPRPVGDLVRRVFNEDLAAVERALAQGAGHASWRDIVRDGSGR